jgi:hypothetical protein
MVSRPWLIWSGAWEAIYLSYVIPCEASSEENVPGSDWQYPSNVDVDVVIDVNVPVDVDVKMLQLWQCERSPNARRGSPGRDFLS